MAAPQRHRRAGERRSAVWPALLLAAAAAPAAAHPHGQLDCAARVQADAGGVAAIDLTLTLDGASSATLQPRLQVGEDGRPPADPDARRYTEMANGLFRQSGWMLQLRPLGADGQPQGEPLPLADPAPARWRRLADGRLEVTVQLLPEAPAAAPAQGWRLACLDPSWYWATGFADAGQLVAAAPCRTELDAMGSLAEQASALQAAARQAGTAGADSVAAGLLGSRTQRAPGGTLRCAPP